MASPIRLTKIVATLGPATESESQLRELLRAGCDVVRLNASHNSIAWREAALERVRRISAELGRHVGVLLDLAGPKIRVAEMSAEPLPLPQGETVVITRHGLSGGGRSFSTTLPAMIDDCRPGQRILLDDGMIELRVTERRDEALVCTVVTGGTLLPRKGINLPETRVSSASLTAKDMEDLAWGLRAGVDYVGLSFVRSAEELRDLRRRIAAAGSAAGLVAKIEKPEAVAAIEEIIAASDAVMVARGDLGVEMDVAEVPLLQKRICRLALEARKPVIVATQMLQSMIQAPQPTRAEVSDVANGILDGADAVMLSGETAVGRYPLESVRMMDHVANLTEDHEKDFADWAPGRLVRPMRLRDARDPATRGTALERGLARGAVITADDIGAEAIVALTHSGATALEISSRRPDIPIIAFSDREDTCRRVSLYRGVLAIYHPELVGLEDVPGHILPHLLERKWVEPGSTVVIISGQFPGTSGWNDMLRICRVEG